MRKLSTLATVLAATLVLTLAVPVGATASMYLTETKDGWRVLGLDVRSAHGETVLVSDIGDGLLVSLGENEVVHLYDTAGRPAGKLAGPSDYALVGGDKPFVGVHPPGYLIDYESGELVVAWRQVPEADLYVVTIDEDRVETTDRATRIRIPLAGLSLGSLISIDAVDSTQSEGNEVLGTMSLVVSEFMLNEVQGAGGSRALPTTNNLRFTTFIPDDYAPAPALVCSGGGLNRYFGGDNRSWGGDLSGLPNPCASGDQLDDRPERDNSTCKRYSPVLEVWIDLHAPRHQECRYFRHAMDIST